MTLTYHPELLLRAYKFDYGRIGLTNYIYCYFLLTSFPHWNMRNGDESCVWMFSDKHRCWRTTSLRSLFFQLWIYRSGTILLIDQTSSQREITSDKAVPPLLQSISFHFIAPTSWSIQPACVCVCTVSLINGGYSWFGVMKNLGRSIKSRNRALMFVGSLSFTSARIWRKQRTAGSYLTFYTELVSVCKCLKLLRFLLFGGTCQKCPSVLQVVNV